MKNEISRISPVFITDSHGHQTYEEVKFHMEFNDKDILHDLNIYHLKSGIKLNVNKISITGLDMFNHVTSMYVINGVTTSVDFD